MPIFRSDRVRLAITPGDAAGIGPEVTVKSLAAKKFPADILVLGGAALFNSVARRLRLKLRFEDVCCPGDRPKGAVPCFFPAKFPSKFHRGVSQKPLTRAAVQAIELAVTLAMKGFIDGIVTAPINKAALKAAGYDIPGHTEYLAELSGTKRFEMMLVGGPLRVALVTRHTPIKDVPSKVTAKRVEEVILLTDKELRRSFGIPRPKLVVCGLNPHAGEKGTIGTEELRAVIPGVRSARKKTNALIEGPFSPDALFVDAYAGKYDAEICMYHDQGLIPLKMISRGHGVNVTLGLPFVRTSPDHGTAYDIASRFIADAGSMSEAIATAVRLARNRRRAISR